MFKPHVIGFKYSVELPYAARLKKRGNTMYAVITTGGKQYRVEKGDVIYVETIDAAAGATVEFNEVFAIGEDGKVKFGTPHVSGAVVKGTVEKHGKGKKITILRYRPKKGSMRKMGHRQPFTKITITDIVG